MRVQPRVEGGLAAPHISCGRTEKQATHSAALSASRRFFAAEPQAASQGRPTPSTTPSFAACTADHDRERLPYSSPHIVWHVARVPAAFRRMAGGAVRARCWAVSLRADDGWYLGFTQLGMQEVARAEKRIPQSEPGRLECQLDSRIRRPLGRCRASSSLRPFTGPLLGLETANYAQSIQSSSTPFARPGFETRIRGVS